MIETETSRPLITKKKSSKTVFLILLIILLGGLLYLGKGLLVAAVVNGMPVYRFSVVSELEKQNGKRVLDMLITRSLLVQEAKKKNIEVTQKEIDAEIKKIETNVASQGMNLDQALSIQGMTRTDLKDQLKLQLIVEKLMGAKIEVNDREVDEFVVANKAQFPSGESEETMKKQAKEQLKNQKIQQKTQEYLTVLRSKGKILYFVQY